jgi:lipopolysaccharide/colanic/teichoic acid biosynthesis glycosyltransferase
MSLVGPRPERPNFVEQFRRQIPDYMIRPPRPFGMTGLAPIKGLRGTRHRGADQIRHLLH